MYAVSEAVLHRNIENKSNVFENHQYIKVSAIMAYVRPVSDDSTSEDDNLINISDVHDSVNVNFFSRKD